MAELYGIGKAVNILEDIGKKWGREIEVGCDGLSALNRCFKAGHDEISSRQSHFDILSGMHGLLIEFKLSGCQGI